MDMANLQDFGYDDIPSAGHLMLEKDRERLHLLRLIAFQLPEIRKKCRSYEPPSKSHFLQIRTLHYLDDPVHPASRKAVLQVRISDLTDTEKALSSPKSVRKFLLLAGPRWDPDRKSVKISCEMFPTSNMNMKWCSDALERLIKEAEDFSDPMTDIKLSTRHADVRKLKKGKRRATIADIPKEWLPVIRKKDR
ncbi:MAG: hypothetical protein CYPHOPRED_003397 [Cyphobasidiales sp. Tagirdzhanova-0007]|nr:MAG: hypothetical protein CYPHOPRED_003397 [Cyphobasidiales sp. Tagirdzhanova-0007]